MSNLGVGAPPETRAINLPRHSSLVGDKRYNSDGTPFWVVRLYNGTGGALTANRPYLITYAGTSETVANPQVTALADTADVRQQIVVALEATANGAWGDFAYQGYVEAGVEGTTDVAAGDFLLVSAGVSTTGLVKDGTTKSNTSVAIACEAQASNSVVTTRVYLLGDQFQVTTATSLTSLGLAAGSVTAPSLFFTGDTNTGIFSATADQLNIACGGQEALRCSSSGILLVDGKNLSFATTTGSKIGTSTLQKIGFFNATPIVQPANTDDLRTALINLGLVATGGANPLNLNGGALTAAAGTFSGNVTLSDVNVILGTATGTKFGTATSQKLSFYNATPIVQPSAYTQTFATADKTHAARTATAVTNAFGTADGTYQDVTGAHDQTILNNNFQESATRINQLIVDLADTASVVNSLIDDLQALGLVA